MVLRNACAVLIALSLAGCIEHARPSHSQQQQLVQVVLTNEGAVNGRPVSSPPKLRRDLERELEARGFKAVWVEPSSMDSAFTTRRSTQGRLRLIASQLSPLPSKYADTKGSDVVLLVETRSAFYSELEGRFRWAVDVRASFARLGDIANPVGISFNAPAILNFPHQGGTDALRYVSGPLAREVGRLAARYLDENTEAEPAEPNQPAPETSQPDPETNQPAPETNQPAPETSQPAPETSQPAPPKTEP